MRQRIPLGRTVNQTIGFQMIWHCQGIGMDVEIQNQKAFLTPVPLEAGLESAEHTEVNPFLNRFELYLRFLCVL